MHPSLRSLLAIASLFCGGLTPLSAESPALDRPTIVCTVGMVADVTRSVAGDRADVSSLIGPGVDPHLYKPTRSDIGRLMKADVVVAVGLHLEGRMDETLDRAAKSGRTVVRVGELLPKDLLLRESEENAMDPHLWMNPRVWAMTAGPISKALSKVDPEGAEIYASNAAALVKNLEELDAWSAQRLATVPEKARVLVTAHDAFEYFGRRYGFEVVGIQGISTESEAGVRDIGRIVDLLVSRGIPAVFVESTVPPRHVEALVAGARARGHTVKVGGELFSDAMGDAGTYEGTYPGMIDHNITTIVRGLGGEAPIRGRLGKLAEESSG
ncbi:MAG: manganese transporter [Phycisphaerae bacterium]|nr:manganese transporter [Phycisphaerae bacterium]